VESIVLIRGADDYAEVALIGGRTLLSGKTLASLERALPSDFLRVHRSHIVNLRRVVRLSPRGGGLREVELEGGLIAPVSRAAWPRLKSRLVS
jgi:DNA-binding LytR/AlgR family response regulator